MFRPLLHRNIDTQQDAYNKSHLTACLAAQIIQCQKKTINE
jgi:hypothetical protein